MKSELELTVDIKLVATKHKCVLWLQNTLFFFTFRK